MMRLLFFRAEALYPVMDKLGREQGLADLFLRDFQFQPFFGRLQLLRRVLVDLVRTPSWMARSIFSILTGRWFNRRTLCAT
jgi:hypothetical protein